MPPKPKKTLRVIAALVDSLGLTSEDAETAYYLADEVLARVDIPPPKDTSVTSSELAPRIRAAIGDMLVEFGYAETEKDADRLCVEVARRMKKEEAKEEKEDDEEKNELGEGEDDEGNKGDEGDEADEADEGEGVCELCARPMPLTFHHLIPRKMHRRLEQRKYREQGLTKEEALTRGIYICRPCHSTIHRTFTHEELAVKYNTLEMIESDERIQRWVAYAEKQKIVERRHGSLGLRYGR